VAGLAGIAVPAAERGGVSRSEGDAGARPGEAAVGGARDEDAAGVAGAIEVEVSIVDDALAIEDDRRVASTVDVIVAVVRSRERPDVAVPASLQIGGGVELGAAPAETVLVRGDDEDGKNCPPEAGLHRWFPSWFASFPYAQRSTRRSAEVTTFWSLCGSDVNEAARRSARECADAVSAARRAPAEGSCRHRRAPSVQAQDAMWQPRACRQRRRKRPGPRRRGRRLRSGTRSRLARDPAEPLPSRRPGPRPGAAPTVRSPGDRRFA